jgi:hypothetical protein
LFTDVRLQQGDDPSPLDAAGLHFEVHRRRLRFRQPCPAHQSGLCCVYQDRPRYCRTFECGLLQRVRREEVDVPGALEKIRAAQERAQEVRELLRSCGQQDEHLSLARRVRKVMSEPLDLAGDRKQLRLRSRLMKAVDRMAKVLERDFLL